MRTVELAKVAAAAEALRLRRMAHRQGMRAAYGAGAAVFCIAVLVLLHVVAFFALVPQVSPLVASVILLGVDLPIAAILGILAMSKKPDAIEEEALLVRQQAVVEMRRSLTIMAIAGEVVSLVLRRPRTTVVEKRPGAARLAAEIGARLMARS